MLTLREAINAIRDRDSEWVLWTLLEALEEARMDGPALLAVWSRIGDNPGVRDTLGAVAETA